MFIQFLKKLENLLVQTKFYWSWARGRVLIVRTDLQANWFLLLPLYRVTCLAENQEIPIL